MWGSVAFFIATNPRQRAKLVRFKPHLLHKVKKRKTQPSLMGQLSFLVAEMGFEPHDLRVMSPASYQTAPLRDIKLLSFSVKYRRGPPGYRCAPVRSHGRSVSGINPFVNSLLSGLPSAKTVINCFVLRHPASYQTAPLRDIELLAVCSADYFALR